MKGKRDGAANPGRDSPATDAEGGDRKMEQIRELMFGGIARDFDRRLKELSQRLDAEAARAAQSLDARIAALEARIDPLLDKLQAQLRQETTARTAALDDVDVRFGHAVRTQRDELNTVLQRHEEGAAAAETRLRDALAQLESRFNAQLQAARDALAATHAELGGEKLAREDLADLMAEVSLRLRGQQDPVEGG